MYIFCMYVLFVFCMYIFCMYIFCMYAFCMYICCMYVFCMYVFCVYVCLFVSFGSLRVGPSCIRAMQTNDREVTLLRLHLDPPMHFIDANPVHFVAVY